MQLIDSSQSFSDFASVQGVQSSFSGHEITFRAGGIHPANAATIVRNNSRCFVIFKLERL